MIASYLNVSQDMPPLRHHDGLKVPDPTESKDLFPAHGPQEGSLTHTHIHTQGVTSNFLPCFTKDCLNFKLHVGIPDLRPAGQQFCPARKDTTDTAPCSQSFSTCLPSSDSFIILRINRLSIGLPCLTEKKHTNALG